MHDPSPIDLVLLQTFYEVARTGSVTRTARLLGRSQPAVSRRLRTLEQDLGVKLFEKVGRRLQLTDHGRKLQDQCASLMAVARGMREQLFHGSGAVEGRVAIGTLPTIASHLLVPALHELLERHRKVSIIFRFGWVPRLGDRLRTGELDLLMVIGEMNSEGLEVCHVGSVAIAAVMSPGLTPDHRGRISIEQLRRHRYLAFSGEPDPTFDLVDRFVAEHGLEDAYTPRIPHIETLRELVVAGSGYALLPSYTARRDRELGRLAALPVEGLEEALDVSLVTRSKTVFTPALRTVRDALHDGAAKLLH